VEILQAKLADIEEEHQAELAASEDLREQIDAKAEARALTAVFDFLQNCKIAPSESLLRIFRRYLRSSSDYARTSARTATPRSRAC
jgi:hypothetical protein